MKSFNYKKIINLSETDSAGIVYFAKFFDIAHECFEAYLNTNDISLSKILFNLDFLLPITSANCVYKKPLRLSEAVSINLEINKTSDHSISSKYQILNSNNEISAEVELKHTFVSKTSWKKIPIPAEFVVLL